MKLSPILVIVLWFGALHASFMIGELYPWRCPFVLQLSSKDLPKLSDGKSLTDDQEKFVARILHNVGIYNGIVAGGFLFVLFRRPAVTEVAEVMFAGAIAAGIFGTATLKFPLTASTVLQAATGAVGLYLVLAKK